MLDIYCARLRPVRRRGVHARISPTAAAARLCARGARFRPGRPRANGADCFRSPSRIAVVAVIRLMQSWRTQFADGNAGDWYRPDLWPDFKWSHFVACFVLIPAMVYLATFVPLYGLSLPDLFEAQRRIFGDNITTAIAGHTYMSSWPSWPFLVRPVWYLFDKIGDDRIAAVVFLGNPLVLWPALAALAVCLRDWIVTRRSDAFLILSFYFGPYLAWAVLPRTVGFHLLLSAGGDGREPRAGLCAEARQQSALAAMGVRRGRSRGLCRDAADLGGIRRNVDGDVQPADAVPELDLKFEAQQEKSLGHDVRAELAWERRIGVVVRRQTRGSGSSGSGGGRSAASRSGTAPNRQVPVVTVARSADDGGGAASSPPAPMRARRSGRRGVGLGGFRHDRRTRHARGGAAGVAARVACSRRRRSRRWRASSARPGRAGADDKQGCDGEAGEMVFISIIL